MKTRKVTLTDVYAKALTDKRFLKALRGKPTQTKKVLAKNGLSMSAPDMERLESLVIESAGKVIHPPPPPWEPHFIIASAVLTILNTRIATLEKSMKTARGSRK